MHLNATLFASTTVMMTGCNLQYNVTITPDGPSLHRETTVSSEIEPHEIEALSTALGLPERQTEGADTPQSKTILTFHSVESGDGWPNGFGGQGSWQLIDTPIGSAHCFLECLGGNTHIADDLVALQDGVDAVDVLVRRQLRTSLQGDKMLPKMLNLLRQRIVPDARDLAVMGWALVFAREVLPPAKMRDAAHDFESRLQEAAVAFLWQRDWITAEEAAALLATAGDGLSDMTPRILARALGMNMNRNWREQMQTLQERLEEAFPEDFDKQLTEAFTKAVGEHTRLAVAWAATAAILTSREVTVRLKAATKPAITNGRWDENLSVVEWELETAPLAVGITAPPLCWSATWAKPNATAQDSILGHVGIDGRDLAEFCLLWNMSTPSQHEAVRDVLNSFAKARSGTNIKAEAADLLGECMAMMR